MRLIDLDDKRQGIVHVVAPELGFILPGATVVCGDSHTATLGALGALAWGIGTSEAEHVMSTQSLWIRKLASLGLRVDGKLGQGVYAKDLALSIIRQLGTSGGVGFAIEYFGPTISALSMEARLTLCNMTIEAGSRFGLIAPDQTTEAYLRPRVSGLAKSHFDQALEAWRSLKTDNSGVNGDFDRLETIDASFIQPLVTWGTTRPHLALKTTCRSKLGLRPHWLTWEHAPDNLFPVFPSMSPSLVLVPMPELRICAQLPA
jgi:3-isopropylmalate/(R)-2-methylmalate dehydratase large subunit